MIDFRKKKLVFFDVETTGLSPVSGDRVIEIAAVKVHDLKPVEEFQTLVNPGRLVSYNAYLINGITDAMLSKSPQTKDVLPKFLQFIEGADLIGHNVKFDLRFMNHELALCGFPSLESFESYDTVKLARGLLPELQRYSLDVLTEHFRINNKQKHRAAADAFATFELFSKLFHIMEERQLTQKADHARIFSIAKFPRLNKRSKLKMIDEAIESGSEVAILYQGAATGWTFRRVNPVKISGTGRQAKLEGYCHLRLETRGFLLNRIETMEVVNKG